MPHTPGGPPGPARYEIRIGGHLAPRWVTWFDGMTLTGLDDGTTVLAGPVVDQAALHGLLATLRDTGLPLLSLARVEPPDAVPTAGPGPAGVARDSARPTTRRLT